jgi:hypothetical protein
VIAALAGPAAAYSVGSGVTDACHERMTARAGVDILLEIPPPGSVEVPGGRWREISEYLLDPLDLDLEKMDETTRFLLTSLIVGAREPDTDGHSIMNIENLHSLHGDPSAVGQYAHSLRGPEDDGAAGDAAAVTGVRTLILELLDEGVEILSRDAGEQLMDAQVYLDFYGRVDVEVWTPLFLVGRAAHAIQDSFSHTIRCDQDGLRKVAHVLNYIDAIGDDFDEQRDGLAHSDSMDACEREDLAPVVEAATAATADLFGAARDRFAGLDPRAPEAVLDEWLTLRTGCKLEDEFCDNGRWLAIVREEQTGPYVSGLFGCSIAGAVGTAAPGAVSSLGLLFLAIALGCVARGRNR